MTDEVAVRKTQQGDHDAFHVLVERHSRAVYRLAYRMTNSGNDAEDVVQETFLRAWKQIGRFDGRSAFSSWLHTIGSNCALDLIRKRKRKQEVQPLGGGEEGETDSMSRIASDEPDPERLAASAQMTSALLPALDQLTEMERVAFVLRHHEGLGIEEISHALNVQQGAAKNTIFRAVQKLRRALAPVRGLA